MIERKDALFFVPMHYWGPILFALGRHVDRSQVNRLTRDFAGGSE